MVTRKRPFGRDTEFAVALRPAVERMAEVSGAEIVALYPYDETTDAFYAPITVGIPEGDVVHALPDMQDQLRHFRMDDAAGKIPEDLSPAHYGPSAWLLGMRRPLVSADALHDVGTSFIRRHKIRAVVGLPLTVGARVVGLLFLNFVERPRTRKAVDVTDPRTMERIEGAARELANDVDSARRDADASVLRAVSALVREFASMPIVSGAEATRGRLAGALERVLAAAHLDAAAIYAPSGSPDRLHLVASRGCEGLTTRAPALSNIRMDDIFSSSTLREALEASDLHGVLALPLPGRAVNGVVIFADRDGLALHRRVPVERTLLDTAADLLGAMLTSGMVADDLDESQRMLGAIRRLSTRLLQPGATQQQALRTAVAALTDTALPELDFEFADIFLLDSMPGGRLAVHASAGATTSSKVHSVVDESDPSSVRRVPVWAAPGMRMLDTRDVMAYVATRRRAVVVAAQDASDDYFVSGYPEDRLERMEVQVRHADGREAGRVHAVRLREAADRAPLHGGESGDLSYRLTDDFTLEADLFSAYGHSSLVRVFIPFGSDETGRRATGVLEAGYHVSRQHTLDRVQIEALRACAATIAVAVETAHAYEEMTNRARQLEIVSEVSRAMARSIDLDQALSAIAANMARAVDASVCLIALLDEDGSAWHGAAASDQEELWLQRRVERPDPSIVFDVADRGEAVVVEDAFNHPLVSGHMARVLGIRSLLALPLIVGETSLGAVLLGQREQQRVFTPEEVDRASMLTNQAAIAIRNARQHMREEEEQHIQKDVVLVGFGQWGQKAYNHLVLLKHFFNFRTHVVEMDRPGRRKQLAEQEAAVLANGDGFYWDSPDNPAHEALMGELEPSCYVITYIATPAETHLEVLKEYYDLSNVVLIEKPLGAPPEEYRKFLDTTDGSVQIVAADHYWFKIEVRLLELLLTEERNLRAFLDEIEEVEIEILEEQPPGGSGAQIGMIADLVPHAFAVLSLLTPLDRVELADHRPLQVGRYQPTSSEHETYARLTGHFDHRGRKVRVTIDVGKGVRNAKWIKLIGQKRMGGRRAFYKFDFSKGEAIDGTQGALRAATRPIRQPGVPDNAHLSMLRHVIEKKHPAIGILSIREALRANARIQSLERMAENLIASGQWTPYTQGQAPAFEEEGPVTMPVRDREAAPLPGGE